MRKILELSKTIVIVFVLLGLSLIFVSCEKDEENKPELDENAFIFNDQTYPTPNAVMVNAGETEGGGTEFEIYFYSADVSYEISEGEVYFSSGVGERVSLYLTANIITDQLPAGEYPYVGQGNLFDFSEIEINTDFGSDLDTGIYLEELTGEVIVSKTGDEYTIEYSLILTNLKPLTGKYTGKINIETSL